MTKWGNIVVAFVALLAFTGAARADLMPVSLADSGGVEAIAVDGAQPGGELRIADRFGFISSLSDLSCDRETDATVADVAQCGSILTDGLSSFELCLYALIGVGLLQSGQCIKRPSVGFVPEWYHSGGPHQVGHSHAVGPDISCVASICFVQPGCTAGWSPAYACAEAIASPRPNSQGVAEVVAPRGPPGMT